MMKAKIPILLISVPHMQKLGRRFRPFGRLVSGIRPGLGLTLSKIGFDLDADTYAVGAIVSSLIYGVLFSFVGFAAMLFRAEAEVDPYISSVLIGFCFFIVFLLLHLVYPDIIVKKIAIKENKDLLFALREIMIDVDGGVPLFDSMKNVAGANYGYISRDFESVVMKIDGGMPEREALKDLAVNTDSEYLKRAAWQMVNALESGARMNDALSSIVKSVENYIYRDIKNYSSSLNFLMLIYMLSAAVVPSMGITFLVLLSSFSGLGVTIETILTLVGLSVLLQVMMIGYMGSIRPEIFGG